MPLSAEPRLDAFELGANSTSLPPPPPCLPTLLPTTLPRYVCPPFLVEGTFVVAAVFMLILSHRSLTGEQLVDTARPTENLLPGTSGTASSEEDVRTVALEGRRPRRRVSELSSQYRLSIRRRCCISRCWCCFSVPGGHDPSRLRLPLKEEPRFSAPDRNLPVGDVLGVEIMSTWAWVGANFLQTRSSLLQHCQEWRIKAKNIG